jgi:hypothetical protein
LFCPAETLCQVRLSRVPIGRRIGTQIVLNGNGEIMLGVKNGKGFFEDIVRIEPFEVLLQRTLCIKLFIDYMG